MTVFVGSTSYVTLANLKYYLLSALPYIVIEFGKYGGCIEMETRLKGGFER